MATIEERALVLSDKAKATYPNEAYSNGIYAGYVKGAYDQKTMDDAKYKKLRDLAYAMYTNAQYLTNDASGLRQSMRNFYHYINFEEE